MNYNKANAPECAITVVPALTELGQRLQDCTNSFDRLTLELKNKLQTIKRFDEPCSKDDETKKREPECIMDELNYMVFRIHDYNNRLEECLMHLNQIA